MSEARTDAVEAALNELVSNRTAGRESWRTTLERLYDEAVANAVGQPDPSQRVAIRNIGKNVDRIATDLHNLMSDLRDAVDGPPPAT